MDVLAVVLTPIIAAMGFILGAYAGMTGSPGLAVVLLSATMSLILFPIQRIALRAERAHAAKSALIQAEVREARKSGLKGEALFNATEAIYQRYRYHPIHALKGSASLFIQLPVLISAFYLLSGSQLLVGHSFLVIPDLAQQDRLLFGINLLPILVLVVTATDAVVRYRTDRSARNRFFVISALLFVLIYAMPAALVLYWLTSNVISLGIVFATATRQARAG